MSETARLHDIDWDAVHAAIQRASKIFSKLWEDIKKAIVQLVESFRAYLNSIGWIVPDVPKTLMERAKAFVRRMISLPVRAFWWMHRRLCGRE